MNNTYKYLIRLKPLCPYFIGGENTFGEDKKPNYFAKSQLMPLQSTLLGMLRYKVLKIHDLLGPRSKIAGDIIGADSFSLDKTLEHPQTFGVIRQVSPLFVMDEKANDKRRFYTAMPLDSGVTVSFEEADCLWSDKQGRKLPSLEGYDPKHYDNYLYWVNEEGDKLDDVLSRRYENNELDSLKHPFIKSEQIGITKTAEKKSDEDAFFKQELITLHPDLCFACTLEITEAIPEEHFQDVVFMGGNRSMFTLTISLLEDGLNFISPDRQNYFWKLAEKDRYLLLSDSYLQDQVFSEADFIWGESISMRTIQNNVSQGVSWNRPKKNCLYHLQSKGSVLYGGESIAGLLEIEALQKVGLNIYLKPNNILTKKD